MKKGKFIAIVLLSILAFLIIWYIASPLFTDKSINEQAPIPLEGEISEAIYEGEFIDADSFHKTSGTARIIQSEGKFYLRLENFMATNGPDLKVYLSRDLEANNYVSLGELKGNIGDQNYEIPEGTDFSQQNTVLIWCERFSVLFGSAKLKGQ